MSIKDPITGCNLLVIIFEIILYIMVQHDIGLYYLIEEGFFTLGIKVIDVLFVYLYMEPSLKNFNTACVTSSLIMCHVFL